MADRLEQAALVLFVWAAVFLVCSVFLWVKFRVPVIVGDLSGRTARKSIAKMREENGNQDCRKLQMQAEAKTECLRREVVMLEEVMLIHTDEVI